MKLIKVKNFADRLTAEQAKQRLHEEGIECMIQSISGGLGTLGATLASGADLYVSVEQEERARRVLADLFGDL
jgi:hypothetical protein